MIEQDEGKDENSECKDEHDEGKDESDQARRPPRIGTDFGITQSLTASSWGLSFDYSTSSDNNSGTDDMESTDCEQELKNLRTELKEVRKQRDFAIEEAHEAKKTLEAIQEAIQILCRQMKSSNVEFEQLECNRKELLVSASNNDANDTPVEPVEESDKSQMIPPIAPNSNRIRTLSGVSTTSISSYTSEDSQRFSELLQKSSNGLNSNLSKIGGDLIALNGVCRTIEQNARHTSDESSIILSDLQHVTAKLRIKESRCRKAEKCAKNFYNENQYHKKELERIVEERHLLIREIKNLRAEKIDKESFQIQLVESMKTYESHMKNQSVPKAKLLLSTNSNEKSGTENEGDANNRIHSLDGDKNTPEAGALHITESRSEGDSTGGKDINTTKTPEEGEKSVNGGGFNPFGILKVLPFGPGATNPTTKSSTSNPTCSESAKDTQNASIQKSNEDDDTAQTNSDIQKLKTAPARAPLQLKSTSNMRNARAGINKSTVSLEELIGLKSSSSSSWVRQVNSPTGSSAPSATGKKAVVKVKVKMPKNKDS